MTLAEIRLLTRTMLYSTPGGGRADVDQRTLDSLLDGINKGLWLRAVKAAESMFTVYADLTTTVNADGSIDFSTITAPTGIYRLVRIELKAISGVYIPLTKITPSDRQTYDAQTVIATALEPSAYFTMRSDSSTSEKIFLVPRPNRSVQLRIFHVPQIANWTVDTLEAIDGQAILAPHHLLIALEAAVLLGATNVIPLRDRMNAQLDDTLRKRHGGPRRIHYEPYE